MMMDLVIFVVYLRLSLVVVIDRIFGGFIGGLTLAVVALNALNNNIYKHTLTR